MRQLRQHAAHLQVAVASASDHYLALIVLRSQLRCNALDSEITCMPPDRDLASAIYIVACACPKAQQCYDLYCQPTHPPSCRIPLQMAFGPWPAFNLLRGCCRSCVALPPLPTSAEEGWLRGLCPAPWRAQEPWFGHQRASEPSHHGGFCAADEGCYRQRCPCCRSLRRPGADFAFRPGGFALKARSPSKLTNS